MKRIFVGFLAISFYSILSAQQVKQDVGVFKSPELGYYHKVILKDNSDTEQVYKPDTSLKYFIMDMNGIELPNKVNLYKQQWHFSPVSQGNTGSCWCFSTTSFFESEVFRLTGQKIKLSEMYTVYWEYVDKATRYIKEKGNSLFDQGSEANALKRVYRNHGIVPLEAYTALSAHKKFYNHTEMFKVMSDYLKSIKAKNEWNEETNLNEIKNILNKYMGIPPTSIDYKGKTYTPVQFLNEVLKLNLDDYIDILSYKQEPFYKQVEYKVPDNWWHDQSYFNVPLSDFMDALINAVKNGYTVCIGGDVTEPGFSKKTQCALIPSFDIPSQYINDDARQFRFSNKTTQDDHGLHLVGYTLKDGKYWFLIKDSGSGSRDNNPDAKEFGYYFFSEDYIKLKMMDFMVHKNAVSNLLKKN